MKLRAEQANEEKLQERVKGKRTNSRAMPRCCLRRQPIMTVFHFRFEETAFG
jgi:hypothetical protein